MARAMATWWIVTVAVVHVISHGATSELRAHIYILQNSKSSPRWSAAVLRRFTGAISVYFITSPYNHLHLLAAPGLESERSIVRNDLHLTRRLLAYMPSHVFAVLIILVSNAREDYN